MNFLLIMALGMITLALQIVVYYTKKDIASQFHLHLSCNAKVVKVDYTKVYCEILLNF